MNASLSTQKITHLKKINHEKINVANSHKKLKLAPPAYTKKAKGPSSCQCILSACFGNTGKRFLIGQ